MTIKEPRTLLSWTAPEFIYHPKTRTWFLALGIIAAGLFAAIILMKNYFFALLVPIASFLIYVHAQKRPRQITVTITAENIKVSNSLSLPHKEIISFWIFEEPEIRALSLETKKILQPKISLPLGSQKPAVIRDLLINFVKEKKQEESLTDIIARKLKF
ncbi:hypothetical protein KJ866_02825 [Patescibacteria group bacterium]|nr:hypothetical protein [Patescibacteria group bacterium]MBU2219966.1 hypothetical protein [Patescibacteria group bacterium]MBU2264824.1 hypothetical protein [Patescibacteria group bacterium]